MVRSQGVGRLSWGILGLGEIAHDMARDLTCSSRSRLAGVAARDPDRARRFAARRQGVRAHASYRALVNDDDIDVVYVASIHPLHRDLALQALEAGKHVLVEKPLGLNASQARDIAAAARGQGRFCMEAMWMRFNPLVTRVVQEVAEGRLGDLETVHADLSHSFEYDPAHRVFDPRLGGGSLLDLGVYPAHLAWLLLGAPKHVEASCVMAASGVDAAAEMTWHYGTGRLAGLTCSLQRAAPSTATVVGTKGTITLQAPMQAPASVVLDCGGRTRIWNQSPESLGYLPEIREVEDCVLADALESPRATLEDSVGVLTVLDDVRSQLTIRYPSET